MDYVKAVLQWTFLLIANLVTDLVGLVVVLVALPFRVDGVSLSDGRAIKNLPKWAWLFGNDYDGVLGDKRLWWDANADASVWLGLRPLIRKVYKNLEVIDSSSFQAMYWWTAVRNPVNNMRLVKGFQCPLVGSVITYKGQAHVRDDSESAGWQFVTTDNYGKKYYGFYWVYLWNTTHCLVVRLGFKTEPSDAGSTEPQGMTTKINPYKAV
jgi:hypothetical protein